MTNQVPLPSKRLSVDQIEKIKELRSQGLTMRKIQELVGASSVSVVQWHLKRNGSVKSGYVSKAEHNKVLEEKYRLEVEVERLKKKLKLIHSQTSL